MLGYNYTWSNMLYLLKPTYSLPASSQHGWNIDRKCSHLKIKLNSVQKQVNSYSIHNSPFCKQKESTHKKKTHNITDVRAFFTSFFDNFDNFGTIFKAKNGKEKGQLREFEVILRKLCKEMQPENIYSKIGREFVSILLKFTYFNMNTC